MSQYTPEDIQAVPAPRLDNQGHIQFAEDKNGFWSSGNSTNVSVSANPSFEETTAYARFVRHFRAEIDIAYADLILIVCGFVSGLVDGLSFNAWGSFASMQSGNTIFIALGVSSQPRYPAYLWAKSLIALCTFLISNILFIKVSRLLGPRRRSTMILSFAIQAICLLIAAILVEAQIIFPRPEDPRAPIQWMQIVPISLIAFQAGGQICASRILAYDEIPTVVLTALLCDLLVDPDVLAKKNPKRNRRIGAFLALFFGAMTAGGLSKVASLASSLWFAFALKLAITVEWVFWRAVRERKESGSIV
ncbi:hypothetical protein BO70DRAFT_367825 [Aspergillus heteromorphus CBS 117.55]|uniref:DUF1275 domain protein n=1 Tax=Aspergillus heteromorphus CBS 117.55 TaxID=1448321 RepID=A0A317X2H9_9EURO|nr:uncharacterized protein BO70DRAFT_367825 [Aspergillus heteromorphus CBS 117.55]PWY92819.1 hypothetical protein BO70DRAFT_367825 [Aspergillus heteromorphus CBS 117.55]